MNIIFTIIVFYQYNEHKLNVLNTKTEEFSSVIDIGISVNDTLHMIVCIVSRCMMHAQLLNLFQYQVCAFCTCQNSQKLGFGIIGEKNTKWHKYHKRFKMFGC